MSTEADKKKLIQWLEENTPSFTKISDDIWAKPELGFKEFTAARLQAEYLEEAGFKIEMDVAGMNTAFVAEWGEGKPIIGFAGEFDALPGLSQKNQATQEPIEEGASGHGCGHNLLGTGGMASAAAVKHWMEENGIKGTVRFYACPAEEGGGGKVFMARAGLYDDLDAAFNYHPWSFNMAMKGSCVAINSMKFRFHGRTAHAGGAPWEGRSALDAVELMNVGVNFLREHVKTTVRIHYIITDGGMAPNIVPGTAEVEYIIRAETVDYLHEVTDRIRKVAEGATLMTETTVEEIFGSSFSNILANHTMSDLQYDAMQFIGSIPFTEEEIAYGQQINDAFPGTNADYIDAVVENFRVPSEFEPMLEKFKKTPLIADNIPAVDADYIMKGATDVGDLSQIAPLSMLGTTCFTTGTPGHSWGNVATGAMSIGHKGMMHAAKIMALAAYDLYSDPEKMKAVRDEFEKKAKPYVCPIPDEIIPPRYEPED